MMTTNIGFAPGTFLDFTDCCNVREKLTIFFVMQIRFGEFVPSFSFQVLHVFSLVSKNFGKDYTGICLNVPYS